MRLGRLSEVDDLRTAILVELQSPHLQGPPDRLLRAG
jgi:hypothetical protein